MIIGCDLDGTICDNLPLLVDCLNKYTGKNITLEDIRQYDVTKTFPITRKQFISLMSEAEAEIITKAPLIKEADKYLQQLAGEHQIHIITARNPRLKELTAAWLKKYQLPYHGLHLLNSHDKVAICQKLAVDVIIEDNYHNALQLSAAGFKVILFNAPHNKHSPWVGPRCSSWREVYQTISCGFQSINTLSLDI